MSVIMKSKRIPKLSIPIKFPGKSKYFILIVLVLVLAAIPGVYFYLQYRNTRQLLKDPQAAASAETQKILSEVARHIELPADEAPTIATISDTEKLKDQPLFARAQNGDKVLVYVGLKKAILYRPSSGKIIDVIPVNVGEEQPTPTVAPVPASFILRNGTTVAGLTRTYETKVISAIPGATIEARENAQSRGYSQTQLFDLTGTSPVVAQEYAQKLGIAVGTLPPEEATTSASFLIILGTDAAE